MKTIYLSPLELQAAIDKKFSAYYCQDKLDSLCSENPITEDQAENIADQSIARAIRGQGLTLVGMESAEGWKEPAPYQPCKICDNGRKLTTQKSQFALCIACTRASMPLERLITVALKTLNANVAKSRLFTSLAIQARANAQRMQRASVRRPGSGRRGADPGRAAIESLKGRK